MNTLEILAPAGNWESLKCAVNNGADAVYLGLNNYSARAKADNFNIETLDRVVDYCHLFNCKVYLTFNTLIKDVEMQDALSLVDKANKIGVDAFIVQDLGLINIISSTMPHIVLHASTQMGIHNLEGVKIAEKLGIKRVVLARETLLEDIIKISKNSTMEIEYFVQGALCVSFSGNCYFSSLVSGYSGNRGKCLQLCRKGYKLNNSKDFAYILSTKDICMLERFNQLADAGVTSFKIEGRMRRAEYVGETTRIYKKASERYTNSCDIKTENKRDIDTLKQLYNRGNYCFSHLDGTEKTIYSPAQGHIGLKIGTVQKILFNKAIISSDYNLSKGDGIKFIRNNNEVGTASISENKNETSFLGDIKIGDEVWLTTNFNLNKEILSRERKLHVSIQANFTLGEKPLIIARHNNTCVKYSGENIIMPAVNSPVTKEELLVSLSKTGDTFFKISQIDVSLSDNIFIAKSEVNALRRNALNKLSEKILETNKNVNNSSTMRDITLLPSLNLFNFPNKSLFVCVDDLEKITKFVLDNASFIIFSPSRYTVEEINRFCSIAKNKAILNLPIISRGQDINLIRDIVDNSQLTAFVGNNLSALELLKGKKIILGHGLNLLNNFFSQAKTLSIEADKIIDNENTIIYSHGFAPLMNLTHCPRDKKCELCDGKNVNLLDERGNNFVLRRQKQFYCYHTMLNCVATDLFLETRKLLKSSLSLDFTNYNTTQLENILSSYINNTKPPLTNKTKGNIDKELK